MVRLGQIRLLTKKIWRKSMLSRMTYVFFLLAILTTSTDAFAAGAGIKQCLKSGSCHWLLWISIVTGVGIIILGTFSSKFQEYMNTDEDGNVVEEEASDTPWLFKAPQSFWIFGGCLIFFPLLVFFG